MCPHGDFAGVVDQLKVAGNALEFLTGLAVLDADLEESVGRAVAVGLVEGDGGELLVGGVVGRRDVVRQKVGISADVAQTDEIAMLDVAAELGLLKGTSRENLPPVVSVVEGVAGDLLALARDTAVIITKRIAVGMAVQVGLGFLVLDGDGVPVVDSDSVGKHDVVAEGLLELRGHEVIAGTGAGQDGEVNLEPEEVEHEWHEDQAERASSKVLAELGKSESTLGAVDVQEVPEINANRRADGDEGEQTNILGGDVAGEGEASQDQPLPPLPREGLVAQLVELDVAEQAARHGEDEGSVK